MDPPRRSVRNSSGRRIDVWDDSKLPLLIMILLMIFPDAYDQDQEHDQDQEQECKTPPPKEQLFAKTATGISLYKNDVQCW